MLSKSKPRLAKHRRRHVPSNDFSTPKDPTFTPPDPPSGVFFFGADPESRVGNGKGYGNVFKSGGVNDGSDLVGGGDRSKLTTDSKLGFGFNDAFLFKSGVFDFKDGERNVCDDDTNANLVFKNGRDGLSFRFDERNISGDFGGSGCSKRNIFRLGDCSGVSGQDNFSGVCSDATKLGCNATGNVVRSVEEERIDEDKFVFCARTYKDPNMVFDSSNVQCSSNGLCSSKNGATMDSGLGTSAKINHDFSQNAATILPEQMKKLDLQGTGGAPLQSLKVGDHGNNIFVFGKKMEQLSNFSASDDPTLVKKESWLADQSCKEEVNLNSGFFSNIFAFCAPNENTGISDKKAEEPLNDTLKCNLEMSANDNVYSGNNKHDDLCSNCNVSIPFVFASCGSKTSHCGESEAKVDRQTNRDLHCGLHEPSFRKSSTFQFKAEKVETGPYVTCAPSKEQADHVMRSDTPKPPKMSPSLHPGFASAATNISFDSCEDPTVPESGNYQPPKKDAQCPFQENNFSVSCENFTFNMKKEVSQDSSRLKKRRGKLQKPFPSNRKSGIGRVLRENNSQENREVSSSGSYSPMDVSPIQEPVTSSDCHSKPAETKEPPYVDAKVDFDSVNDFEIKTCHASAVAEVNTSHEINTAPKEDTLGFTLSNSEEQDPSVQTGLDFGSSSNISDRSKFTFTASSSSQCLLSASKRLHRLRNQRRAVQDSYDSKINAKLHAVSSNLDIFPFSKSSCKTEVTEQAPQGVSVSCNREEKLSEAPNDPDLAQKSSDSASSAAYEACKKWRLRGNQAYTNGHLSKAEKYYTCGINAILPNEDSKNCTQALMLCYSNRAATRMSRGRMREALSDCMMALAIDPCFLRAQLRAANCHLSLGRFEEASELFIKFLQSRNDATLETRMLEEASLGLQNAQKASECLQRSSELLRDKKHDNTIDILAMISEALSISPHSDKLIKMKAKALLMSRSYEEVIKLCESTMESAKRNYIINGSDDQLKNNGGEEMTSVKIWRGYLISRSFFYMGRLEDSLQLLQQQELTGATAEKFKSKSSKMGSFAATIKELLRLKAAGNDAFQAGKHLEAVEYYSAALSCNVDSRPFAAICFCNRAASYQALGQVTNAIADCSLATVLDANYSKAMSRRATLYEMVRDYEQATADLRRLISILEGQADVHSTGSSGKSSGRKNDLKRARQRLATVEKKVRNETPLDMYMILGLNSSSKTMDIKKAYHKAALKHHPDKSAQFVNGENTGDSLWKEVADEARRNADHLFKMIGEAYAVLSDPTKRMQYDEEEEIRAALKDQSPYGSHRCHYERSGYRRESQDPWRSYRERRPSDDPWTKPKPTGNCYASGPLKETVAATVVSD